MAGLGALPSLDNLQCFLAAAERLNFRNAAAAMSLTATAFGQRIHQLEEQVGRPLFERTTRRVRLTEAGAALVPVARHALAQAERCFDVVRGEEAPAATFVLGTRFELGLSWIVPAVADLVHTRPEWTIHLYFGSGQDLLNRLLAGDVDAVVTSAPVARAGWVADVLHPETYVLCAAPSLVADRPFEHATDAARHTLLDLDRTMPLSRYLGEALAFGDVRYLGTGGAAHRLVLAGHGVAVLPEYMVTPDLAAGRLVRLLPDRKLLTDTFRLIYSDRSPHARSLRALAEVLRARPLE